MANSASVYGVDKDFLKKQVHHVSNITCIIKHKHNFFFFFFFFFFLDYPKYVLFDLNSYQRSAVSYEV